MSLQDDTPKVANGNVKANIVNLHFLSRSWLQPFCDVFFSYLAYYV